MSKLLRTLGCLLALALLLTGACSALAEAETPALTLEDLQAMNDGQLVYTLNDEGFVTFLRGKFYDGAFKSMADVEKALDGVGRLLGADETTDYLKGNHIIDDQGYNYYTLYQWQDDSPVDFAIVKVIADPEGQGVALSSSIVNGASGTSDKMITPEQALALVKERMAQSNPGVNYTYYEDDIGKTRTQRRLDDGSYSLTLAYIVYTDNPGATLQDNGLAYLAHYVSAMGEYLYDLPVSSIGNEYALIGNDNARVFEGKTTATYSGTVVGKSGASHEITVPVMLDESTGTYYLADPQRKIVMADYWAYNYNDENVALLSSENNADWDTDALLAYDNYILTYDFYNAVGWPSSDGVGTPMLLLTHYVDEERNPIANACYQGKNGGWQVFAATSDALNAAEALDIVGHEFTHGVTTASITQILYENQYGAINESLSDIMGNLIEMLNARTEDTEWLIGEGSGSAARSMSDPNAYGQPKYIGDAFFVPNASLPSSVNDRGGVHVNNSLLSGIAPKLYDAGMTLEEERLLWTTFICAITPRTGYAEANIILPFAADVAGLDKYQDAIAKALDEIGMNNADPFGAPKDGNALMTLRIPESIDATALRIVLTNEAGRRIPGFENADTGDIRIIAKPGSYAVSAMLFDSETHNTPLATLAFDGEKWTEDMDASVLVTINAGETVELATDGLALPQARQTSWDLTDLYADDAAFEQAFADMQALIDKIPSFRGTLNTVENVVAWYALQDTVDVTGSRLGCYTELKTSLNAGDAAAQALSGRVTNLQYACTEAKAFAEVELFSQSEEFLDALEQDERMLPYLVDFTRAREESAHLLPEEQEKLLLPLSKLTDGARDLYEVLSYLELPRPDVVFPDGVTRPANESNYTLTLYGGFTQDFRKTFAEALFGSYRDFRNVYAQNFSNYLTGVSESAKAHGYASALDEALAMEYVDPALYQNVIDGALSGSGLLRRYAELMMRELGLDEVYSFDMNLPIAPDPGVTYTYDEACDLVLAALAPLGEKYVADARQALAGGWVDAYPAEGKQSGAYSMGIRGAHPYMLLNFNGTFNSVSTLAHELGHTMNTWYSDQAQATAYAARPGTIITEVTSTLNELLLSDYMIKNAETDVQRKYYIAQQMSTIYSTFFTQSQFARFQQLSTEALERGEVLTADLLGEIWIDNMRQFDDGALQFAEGFEAGWARIPHFYQGYYVYQYAAAISASCDIAQRITSGEAGAAESYLNYISSGDPASTADTLLIAGVDASNGDFIDGLLTRFGALMDEYEAIA